VKEIDYGNIVVCYRKDDTWHGLLEEMEVVHDASKSILTVSSNSVAGICILDGNESSCWQSDCGGVEGVEHWVMVELPRDVTIINEVELFLQEPVGAYSSLTLVPPPPLPPFSQHGGSAVAYLPEDIDLYVGNGTKDKDLKKVKSVHVTRYDWSDLLDSDTPGRVFKMVIKKSYMVREGKRLARIILKLKPLDRVVVMFVSSVCSSSANARMVRFFVCPHTPNVPKIKKVVVAVAWIHNWYYCWPWLLEPVLI